MSVKTHTFGERVLAFNRSLHNRLAVPEDIEVLNPFLQKEADAVCRLYYRQYYGDNHPRTCIFGINPGRHGAGVTGIPFTDPVQLEKACALPNPFEKKAELSSTFVYMVVEAYGGVQAFCRDFFLTALCPLGFTAQGKNINYYDRKDLLQSSESFILSTLREQLHFGVNREVCLCMGEGKNYEAFRKWNAEHGFFEEIIPLPHPRFVLQYRRKESNRYIRQYLEAMHKAIGRRPDKTDSRT